MDQENAKKEMIKLYLTKKGRISCKETVDQLRTVMTQISGEDHEAEQWLKKIYEYCVAVYFPENFSTDGWKQEVKDACAFYLDILSALMELEQKYCPFDRCRDFQLLTEKEKENSSVREEYEKFCEVLKNTKICEFMRVATEATPFDTLGHIAGVHFVAMYIARQLAEHTSVKIDLGLISAAALIHDIGKFGCRKEEAGRVPYLHYYYTQQFAQRFDLETIGHTAANHSTWDLELENLSVENLLLIYADFRVKSIRENGKEKICFWSLDESYRIILSKLDNVDEKKARRYRKVFMKLRDFEDFLLKLGVATDLEKEFCGKKDSVRIVFMDQKETAECFRLRAVGSNLMVMNTFSDPRAFAGLLEEANSEKDWRNVRSYLNVLDEYSAYLSCEQKEVILNFLYEMLMNRDGDIRRQAAAIMGKIIAQYEIKYQKEIPRGAFAFRQKKSDVDLWNEILGSILVTDHKIAKKHRRWIGFALKTVFRTLLETADLKKRTEFLEVLLGYYHVQQWDELALFILADCALEIPWEECTEQQKKVLHAFMDKVYETGNYECQIAVRRFRAAQNPEENQPGEVNLIELFQKNQKIEVPWIEKMVNLEILNRYFRENKKEDCFQLATHLVNVLQNSDRIVIRHQAGKYLTELMDFLSADQRYEIVVELTKGLEVGEYSVSRYIPEHLGKIFYTLEEDAQKEMLRKYSEMIDGKNYKVAVVTLETIGIAAQHLYLMNRKTERDRSYFTEIREQLEGLLLKGMAHYLDEVRQEAFYIAGHSIFGSSQLTLLEKAGYFCSVGKKMLSLMKQEKIAFYLYNNAAALNHIYRFLLDYRIEYGDFPEPPVRKAAFFPGTFDPFSKGHKAVVEEILKYDMEVYLALDEFSWSKKTQPYKIRRRIVEMSVADLKNVYLFPADIPVNIANPKSLHALRETVKNPELYIVVGSDVVMNASAYRKEPEKESIHNFAHIVLQRDTRKKESRDQIRKKINGKILWLDIKEKGENISSTRIRENIDRNRDISNLVEQNVQNYIYEKNLYVREPMYRQRAGSRMVSACVMEKMTEEVREELSLDLLKHGGEIPAEESAVLLRNDKVYGRIEGAIFYHRIMVRDLYEECRDEKAVSWFRKHISEQIYVLSGIYYRKGTIFEDNCQAVFMETMTYFIEKEVSYVLCRSTEGNREFLKRQGFMEGPEGWLLADVRRPLVFFADMPTPLKQPFAENREILGKIMESRKKLQYALTALYPGKLVLTMDSYIINYRLVSRIAKENNRSLFQLEKTEWGEKMCVPFGKIMKGTQVPNTVTKELNTEKIYSSDMQKFVIREYPEYAEMEVQLRTIRAFDRPVILVDNLFHKSYRMNFIEPYLKKEKVPVDKILVSVITGVGRDIAVMKGWDVEGIYFIPNMRTWFIESDFYPFIGGDSIEKKSADTTMLPSVNPVLPYEIPSFLKGIRADAFYHLSEVCLENTLDILEVLENEYQKLLGRKLTLERLGEVLTQSRYPDISTGVSYRMNEAPSVYLKYELERLKRMYAFTLYGNEKGEQ